MNRSPPNWQNIILWVAAFLSPVPGILVLVEGEQQTYMRDAAYLLVASCLLCAGVALYGFFRRRGTIGRVIDGLLLSYGFLIGFWVVHFCGMGGLEGTGYLPCV
jgi:hypothetical protein